MRHSKYFRHGSRVVAKSITGETILGIYQKPHKIYGAVVFGRPLGSQEIERDHHCTKLSMELYLPPKPKGALHKSNTKIVFKDAVLGQTSMGLTVTGFYMHREGKYAWIKGWLEGVSKFEPKEAHKVLSSTLVKLALTNQKD